MNSSTYASFCAALPAAHDHTTDLALAEPALVLNIIQQRLNISLADGKVATTFTPTNEEIRDSAAATGAPPLALQRFIHFVEGPPANIKWSSPLEIIEKGPDSFEQRLTWRTFLRADAFEKEFSANQEPYNFFHRNPLSIDDHWSRTQRIRPAMKESSNG